MEIRKQQVDWLLDIDYASRMEAVGRPGVALGVGSSVRTCFNPGSADVTQDSIEKKGAEDER